MAEYDKGRYYWIKLTDRFMTSDTVDFLMSQKDGANYVVLYQMLCLKTVNNGGLLARTLGEILVPYNIEKIQRDCKWFSMDTVRIAFGLYKSLGLIYENKDGMLAISEFERLVGSQSYGAEKKELQKRRREDNLLEGGTKVENFPPNIDIDKDIDKEKEKNISNICSTAEKSAIKQKPSVIDLTLNTGELYGIDEDSVKEWESLYPAVNVMQELRNMKGWLDANPTRRKTKSGIKRFINNWLSKEQNKGGVNNAKPYAVSSERNSGYDEIQFGLYL